MYANPLHINAISHIHWHQASVKSFLVHQGIYNMLIVCEKVMYILCVFSSQVKFKAESPEVRFSWKTVIYLLS